MTSRRQFIAASAAALAAVEGRTAAPGFRLNALLSGWRYPTAKQQSRRGRLIVARGRIYLDE